jgi:hypothetical protein
MSRDWRVTVQEIDLAGFVTNIINVTGYMPIISSRGRADKPLLIQSERDVLTNYEKPSADYPSLFELIAYTKKAPCWGICAIGSGALYGGVDISATGVTAFASGRVSITDYDYADSPTSYYSFFAASQYTDDLRATISHTSGQIFSLALDQKKEGLFENINTYNFSLKREKDGFGKSLYIDDIFQNNAYVIPKLNSNLTPSDSTFDSFVNTTISFAGGARGATPSTGNITSAWEFAKQPNKYEAKIMMDTFGSQAVVVNNIIQTYQPYSFAITVVPFGQATDVAGITSYRSGLGIDSDDIALYVNHVKIVDSYNDSFAWISNIGSIGGKLVDTANSFNFASPAGIDENGYGGQLDDWQVTDTEFDFTEFTGGDTQTLDQSQVNPLIFDNTYGLIIKGDRTLQVSNSDTSFIGTRRGYNFLIENIEKQILTKQVFKINDVNHREQAELRTNNFVEPVKSAGWLRDYKTVCDTSNNTNEVLDQRQFVLDLYVQVTPNSQQVKFNFVRVGQTVDVNQVLI